MPQLNPFRKYTVYILRKDGSKYSLSDYFKFTPTEQDSLHVFIQEAIRSFPQISGCLGKIYETKQPSTIPDKPTLRELREFGNVDDAYLEYDTYRHADSNNFIDAKIQNALILVMYDPIEEEEPRSLYTVDESRSRFSALVANTSLERLNAVKVLPPVLNSTRYARAELNTLRSTQVSSRPDAVHNGRPLSLSAPPVAIYHPVFAQFTREMAQPHTNVQLSHEELRMAYDFVMKSLNFYETGRQRVQSLTAVEDVLAGEVLSSSKVNVGNTIIKPDGRKFSKCSHLQPGTLAVNLLVEVKNEIGEGFSDPIAQAECDYVVICSSESYPSIRDVSCCPTFLIGIAGPHLTVSGAIFADRIISERLTDYIFLGPLPSSRGNRLDEGARRVAQLFHVLQECLDMLDMFYAALKPVQSPSAESKTKHTRSHNYHSTQWRKPHPDILPFIGPHFTEFQIDGEVVQLRYVEPLADEDDKGIFKALAIRGDKTESVVVKFTATYGKQGHELLSKAGLAPRLWFCEQVKDAGDLWVVVMDYVQDTVAWTPAAKDLVRDAIGRLHTAGLVFGDVRDPNILKTDSGPMLIDFDWCGQAGEARYPCDINLDDNIGWHSEVVPGGEIQMHHDIHLLDRLI